MLGIEDARLVGITLKKYGYQFDIAYTSLLTRASRTMDTVLEVLNQSAITKRNTWRLNPRHFGEFTCRPKNEIYNQYGEEQVSFSFFGEAGGDFFS